MKNGRIILVVSLILICFAIFTVFKYVSALKEQNKELSVNVDKIIKRIAVLELDKTMEKITALRAENIGLKKQIVDLASRCPGEKTKQEIKELKKKEKAITGNRGFLIKNGKPVH